ncbi:single-stranded DNA-binding protein [Fulvivirga sp. 29W222]|uniref:Single-stranded DNA-binding protein n=1 Tax=Fulvivirga marina TaxID=2494733 RepID=A0A937KES3_9BACT|nr:single-stranded DNA-binding protein [Fulvivirga marina]MBL6447485.1 single-stranded DNA-binding protein [Fulvivirga marina]
MSGVNKVIIVGRLGKDPEVRHLESGASVANFPVATSEVYKDRNTGERREQTEWHNVVLWRGLADISEKYLNKGDMVYIEGKLRTRSWEKDGVTRYTTEIVGDNMTMLTPKGMSEGGGSPAPSRPQETASSQASADIAMDDESDDLPF